MNKIINMLSIIPIANYGYRQIKLLPYIDPTLHSIYDL